MRTIFAALAALLLLSVPARRQRKARSTRATASSPGPTRHKPEPSRLPSAEDQIDRLPALVDDLIQWPVALIVGDTNTAIAAKAATATLPIIFAGGGDPIQQGLVASLNRPGGNVTGVNFRWGAGRETAGAATPARAQGDNNCRARVPGRSQPRGGAKRRAGRSASDRAATHRSRYRQRA